MAFLELAFNLPKNNRVISFEILSKTCNIAVDQVEFMAMKAMALELIKGSINQIKQEVTITWVAPKVLEMNRIATMLGKFEQWEDGIKKVEDMVKAIHV